MQTCILVRRVEREACSEGIIASYFSTFQGDFSGSKVGGEAYGWTMALATFTYMLNKDATDINDTIKVDYSLNFRGGSYLTNLLYDVFSVGPHLTDCLDPASQGPQDAIDVMWPDGGLLSSPVPGALEVMYKNKVFAEMKDGDENLAFWLANAADKPIFRFEVKDAAGNVVDVVTVEGTGPLGKKSSDKARELDIQRALYNESGGLVEIECAATTDDPYATRMTVGGINPFDTRAMVFFILMGLILSVYGYFMRW